MPGRPGTAGREGGHQGRAGDRTTWRASEAPCVLRRARIPSSRPALLPLRVSREGVDRVHGRPARGRKGGDLGVHAV